MTDVPVSQQSDDQPDLMKALLDSLTRHLPFCVYADGEECNCGADARRAAAATQQNGSPQEKT